MFHFEFIVSFKLYLLNSVYILQLGSASKETKIQLPAPFCNLFLPSVTHHQISPVVPHYFVDGEIRGEWVFFPVQCNSLSITNSFSTANVDGNASRHWMVNIFTMVNTKRNLILTHGHNYRLLTIQY